MNTQEGQKRSSLEAIINGGVCVGATPIPVGAKHHTPPFTLLCHVYQAGEDIFIDSGAVYLWPCNAQCSLSSHKVVGIPTVSRKEHPLLRQGSYCRVYSKGDTTSAKERYILEYSDQ